MAALDDDPELRDLLEKQRRYGVRRAVLAGIIALGAAGAGVVAVLYGRSLDASQAHSDMHFFFPGQMQFVGAIVSVVAVSLKKKSFMVALRMRVRRGL